MTSPIKLDGNQKHIINLIVKGRKDDGWTPVSAVLYPFTSTLLPEGLAVFERLEDGSGRAKLTEQGEDIHSAMAWL